MGTALITIKLMPASLETDLEDVKGKAIKLLEEKGAKRPRFEEEPVAFGLKALKVFFEISEDQELDPIEQGLAEMEGVNSSQVIDMRRALE